MYLKKMSKTMMWGFILLCSIVILTSCSNDKDNSPQSEIDWEWIEKGIVLDEEINAIEISSDVFSMTLEPSPDEHAHVSFHSSAMKEVEQYFSIKYALENGHLHIAVKAIKNMTGTDVLEFIRGWDAMFHIQLPVHRLDAITLSSNIGNINLQHIQVDELTVTNDVGKIELSYTDSNHAQLKNTVGTVTLDHIKGPAHVKNSTGVVNVHSEHMMDDLDIETALGAVHITMANHPEQIALDLVTEIGSIDTNLDLSFKRNTKRSVIGEAGSDGPTVKVRTEIGKISVQHQ